MSDQQAQELTPAEREAREAAIASIENTTPVSVAGYCSRAWDAARDFYLAARSAEQVDRPDEDDNGPCADCGESDYAGLGGACWFADNALWNEVVEDARELMLCPSCFAVRATAKAIAVGFRAGRVGEIEEIAEADVERLIDRMLDYDLLADPEDAGRNRVIACDLIRMMAAARLPDGASE